MQLECICPSQKPSKQLLQNADYFDLCQLMSTNVNSRPPMQLPRQRGRERLEDCAWVSPSTQKFTSAVLSFARLVLCPHPPTESSMCQEGQEHTILVSIGDTDHRDVQYLAGSSGAALMSQWMKNLPAVQKTQEMRVWSLGQEDPLEEEMATHSGILAWEILWTEGFGGYSQKGHKESGMTEQLSTR